MMTRRRRRRRRMLVDTLALVSSSHCVIGVYSIFSLKPLKYDQKINKQQGHFFFNFDGKSKKPREEVACFSEKCAGVQLPSRLVVYNLNARFEVLQTTRKQQAKIGQVRRKLTKCRASCYHSSKKSLRRYLQQNWKRLEVAYT